MENLVPDMIQLMQLAGRMSLSPRMKKKYVMDKLAHEIKLDNEVEKIILAVIDLLIQVENGELVLNAHVKQISKSIFSCLKK